MRASSASQRGTRASRLRRAARERATLAAPRTSRLRLAVERPSEPPQPRCARAGCLRRATPLGQALPAWAQVLCLVSPGSDELRQGHPRHLRGTTMACAISLGS